MSCCEIVISGFGWVTPFAWGPIHRVMDELSSLRAQSRLDPGYSAVPDAVGDDCTPAGNEIKKDKGALIVAIALGVGLGIQVAPANAFNVIISEVRLLTSDGIVMGILTAMVLNIILPKEPNSG